MVQALKALVIGMGILIAIGMAVLGYGIYQKAKELDLSPKKTVLKSNQSGFKEKTLPIPPGCRIIEMKPDGSRLYLRLGSESSLNRKCMMILVVDTDSGKILGSLKTAP